MELIPQGLVISAVGLVTAFAAMSSFILIIVLLQRIFPAKTSEKSAVEAAEPVLEMKTGAEEPSANAAIVAVIAAALAAARTRAQSTLGADLGAGRGAWWSMHLLNARQGKPNKK